MELKGSRTEANLKEAFAGESQARNKYTYFASAAKKEGHEQIAAVFLETAEQEKEHAKHGKRGSRTRRRSPCRWCASAVQICAWTSSSCALRPPLGRLAAPMLTPLSALKVSRQRSTRPRAASRRSWLSLT